MTARSVRPPDRAVLSRMEEARRATQRQLDLIERDIARRMAAFASRQRRSCAGESRIRPSEATAFRRRYRETLAALTAERQPETDALARKLGRQDRAIDTFRERHGRHRAGARAGATSHPTLMTERPMPIFTIETTYHLPIFRHQAIEAESLEEACRLAVVDDDWESSKKDFDCSGDIHVTGIWGGDVRPYSVAALAVPPCFEEAVQRKAKLFAGLLALLKEPAQPMGLSHTDFERWLPRALAAIVEAYAVIAADSSCGAR